MPAFKNYLSVLLVILVLLAGAFSAYHLEIQDNLTTSIPADQDLEAFMPVLKRGSSTIVFSLAIGHFQGDTYRIDSAAGAVSHRLRERFAAELDSLHYRTDVDPEDFNSFINDHLYLFLEKDDYPILDSLIQEEAIRAALAENKQLLGSTQGLGMTRLLTADPLHFSRIAYRRLSEGMDLTGIQDTEGLYLTKDREKILIQGSLLVDPQQVQPIQEFKAELEEFTAGWNGQNPASSLSYFGPFLITAENAAQIKRDIVLTVNLALAFIVGLLYFYYRRLSTILLFVLPGLVGIAAALTVVYLMHGGISALALSASAVIMGIVVDYSFHFFSHLNQEKDAFKTRDSIAFPLAISSITTVIAFFSLLFANSEALRDFGLFTGLSLVFTLLFILLVFPYFLRLFSGSTPQKSSPKLDRLVSRLGSSKVNPPAWLYVAILVLTGFLAFFAGRVAFEEDLHKLNYYPEALKQQEIAHQNINPDTQKRITLLSFGATADEAMQANRTAYRQLTGPAAGGSVDVNSLASFVLPRKEVMEKSTAWNSFWQSRQEAFVERFGRSSDSLGFRKGAFSGFLSRLGNASTAADGLEFAEQYQTFSNLIIRDGHTGLISTAVFDKTRYEEVKRLLADIPGILIVDGESVASALVDAVKADFNLLLILASVTVFLTMLLVYGRIELTLISFLPMVLSWLWIMGLAALFDLKFNFINIMIATIIFGLGDDFAIFITDGLQSKYKTGKSALATHKAGIILSSVSTIIGTGVLFFGQHPAIRSIAAVSVIGISTIVLLSFVVQPFLYRTLITGRTERHQPPYTLLETVMSLYAFSLFFVGCMLTSLVTLFIIWIPFWKVKSKKLLIHRLIRFFTWLLMTTMFILKKRYYGIQHLDFGKPSILIANHSSFLDILYIAMQHPKLTFLVGPWVYNSPIFGKFIRFADYIPAFLPIEDSLDKIRELVADGYSILVFPESHRSADGQLTRFHKGAFYLSELLGLPITPILLHGLHYCLPKGEFYVKSSYTNMKILPRIHSDDPTYGSGYREKAKAITRYFKAQHQAFTLERRDAAYLRKPLLYAYLYKGPVLEWYFRIKYRHEQHNYELIHNEIGPAKTIYDLGCGYGFLTYFLKLKDRSRHLTGIDYDDEKIQIAQHSYLKESGIHFEQQDINEASLIDAEAIILMDVLHYLKEEDRHHMLMKCLPCLENHGVVLIKDALKDETEKHRWTIRSEKWSTQWLGFNKTTAPLSFFDRASLEAWAETYGLSIRILSTSDASSNALMAIRKRL